MTERFAFFGTAFVTLAVGAITALTFGICQASETTEVSIAESARLRAELSALKVDYAVQSSEFDMLAGMLVTGASNPFMVEQMEKAIFMFQHVEEAQDKAQAAVAVERELRRMEPVEAIGAE